MDYHPILCRLLLCELSERPMEPVLKVRDQKCFEDLKLTTSACDYAPFRLALELFWRPPIKLGRQLFDGIKSGNRASLLLQE